MFAFNLRRAGRPRGGAFFPKRVPDLSKAGGERSEFVFLLRRFAMPREYVWLECTESGMRNYRVSKETRGTERLELMKYCPKLRRHTLHKESRKK